MGGSLYPNFPAELQKILKSAQFEDFSIDLLTEEQLQEIRDRLAKLGLSISEINALLAHMQGKKDDELGFVDGGEVDVLGFTQQQWEKIFENAERLSDVIGKVGNVVQAASQAYSLYDKFVTAKENKRLRKIEQNAERDKAKQKRLLDGKFITQKQYEENIAAIDEKVRKQKAEAEYKQAKRQKAINIASILGNQAVAVSKALAQGGFVLGIPWAAIVGALAGIQLALAVAQPLPAKGFEKGFYGNRFPVQREQDGKIFNAAFGGESRSGEVDTPTVFLAGEAGKNSPELIINGGDLKRFNPDLKNSLYRELGRIRGFESGLYNRDQIEASSGGQESGYNINETLMRTNELLEKLERNGVTALMSKHAKSIKELSDELEKHRKRENKNKR